MRFQPESLHGANNGLDVARTLMEDIKKEFPWVSYGDLWTLAGVCAIQVYSLSLDICAAFSSLPSRRCKVPRSHGVRDELMAPRRTLRRMDVSPMLLKVKTISGT